MSQFNVSIAPMTKTYASKFTAIENLCSRHCYSYSVLFFLHPKDQKEQFRLDVSQLKKIKSETFISAKNALNTYQFKNIKLLQL